MENQSQIYEKEIQITNISQRSGTSAKGNQYTAFTLHGNDGIGYSTLDKEWAAKQQVGAVLKIKFKIRNSTGPNGQLYTNHDLITPRISLPDMLKRLIVVEARLGIVPGQAVIPPKSVVDPPVENKPEPAYPPKESEVEVINVDEPVETTETKEIPNDGKPF